MNRPVHFEIHATDPAKLSKFYADVFGWQITHMPAVRLLPDQHRRQGWPGHQWRLRQAHGRWRRSRCAGQRVRLLAWRRVGRRRGREGDRRGRAVALPKMAIPGIGWQAYIRDPDDNIVGLHQQDPNAK